MPVIEFVRTRGIPAGPEWDPIGNRGKNPLRFETSEGPNGPEDKPPDWESDAERI